MAKAQQERGLAPVQFPEPPAFLRAKNFTIGTMLKVFGPGAIIASITIGSGETIFAARGGAVFGYTIIWALVLGCLVKGALMFAANRYMTVTGEHPMTRWATLFPGPRGWFPLLIGGLSILAFPAYAGGLSLAIGSLLEQISVIPISAQVWATLLVIVCATLAWVGGYDWLEKIQTLIIGFMLIAVLVAVFVAQPDWGAALLGLVPQYPAYPEWIRQNPELSGRPVWVEVVTYIGTIGGGTYDYIGYTGMLREKKWGLLGHSEITELEERFVTRKKGEYLPLDPSPDNVARARAWLRAPVGDVTISIFAITLFTIAFVMNGANLLNSEQLVPAGQDVLTFQARFLTVISPLLRYLYYAAVICAFFGTLYGLWEVYAHTAHETFAAVSAKVRLAGQRRTRRFVYPYVFIFGMLLVWSGFDPVFIITPAAVVGGVLTAGIFCLALIWTENQMLEPPFRMGKRAYWYVLVSGIFMTILGIISFLQLIGVLPSSGLA